MDSSIYIAYSALASLAIFCIYFGSFDSLKNLKSGSKKKTHKAFPEFSDSDESDEEAETVSDKDAYMFPLYGSITLFSMYLLLKYMNKDYVNMLLSIYFAFAGIAAVSQSLTSTIKRITKIKLPIYYVSTVHKAKQLFMVKFTFLHIISTVFGVLIVGAYMYTKNWILSEIIGICFCLTAIKFMKLDKAISGIIMLSGLFLYDIFWVFGTEVMVSVAKNLDAPIKLVFPKNIFDADGANKFVMLGLGDIIVPGVFIALCLRFDQSVYLKKIGYQHRKPLPEVLKGKKSNFSFPTPYFTACLTAYIAGLATTIFVMHTFKAAQPALLYLSPACILSVLGLAAVRGELSAFFAYEEDKPEDETSDSAKAKKSNSKSAARKAERSDLSNIESGAEASDDEAEAKPTKLYSLRSRAQPASESDSTQNHKDKPLEENNQEALDLKPLGNSNDVPKSFQRIINAMNQKQPKKKNKNDKEMKKTDSFLEIEDGEDFKSFNKRLKMETEKKLALIPSIRFKSLDENSDEDQLSRKERNQRSRKEKEKLKRKNREKSPDPFGGFDKSIVFNQHVDAPPVFKTLPRNVLKMKNDQKAINHKPSDKDQLAIKKMVMKTARLTPLDKLKNSKSGKHQGKKILVYPTQN
ncbi:hypothetical protein BB560_000833 [Smittium megazygosporum]|uniref:Uncharacterized protein n=1 Tax=Smittium megazygosporum TaxID=133381 RepID=A0A2T9ZJ92_9FUNG|nr:hypothetical protein BB560_000833 [Smittium megazygosporum]